MCPEAKLKHFLNSIIITGSMNRILLLTFPKPSLAAGVSTSSPQSQDLDSSQTRQEGIEQYRAFPGVAGVVSVSDDPS